MESKSCLIIETEQYLSESISSRLENLGFTVKIISSTEDSMLFKEKYSLLILSLNLQNDNNFFKIIKKFKNSTVILMSSHIDNSCILKAINYGADDFILKPFPMEALIQKIENFQKMKELEIRVAKISKFVSTVLSGENENSFIFEKDLPIIVKSKFEKEIDFYVFSYSENLNLGVEIISFKELLKNIESNKDVIYYLRNFSKLSNRDKFKVLELSQRLNIIIGVTGNRDITIFDFTSFNIVTLDSNKRQIEDILTVTDYIKQVIIENQDKMPDTELAKCLGVSRKSLWEKRKKFNILKIRKNAE